MTHKLHFICIPLRSQFSPQSEPSLSALVSRILPLCGHYSQLVRFVEDKSLYHHGLVNQALAAALTSLIKDYMVSLLLFLSLF